MITMFLAIWGAVISTGLFIVRVWEIRRDRFRLPVTIGMGVGGPDRNVIYITNQYKNPITIEGFELYWAKDKKGNVGYKALETGLEQECNISIAAYATRPFVFEEEYAFSFRADRGNLYLKLHIAGRKKDIVHTLFKSS
jgi:hypothetical protein